MSTVAGRIAEARARLIAAGLPPADAALDAEVLARHLLGWDRAALISRGQYPEPPGFPAAFDALVLRRCDREPVAYIVGHREFWGLELEVAPGVLVPRPETELIVEEALALAGERPVQRVIDVGTGSGCLAVAIASELSGAHVIATDLSPAALGVAARNAARHGVADRVRFVRTDLLDGVCGPADLIVSNPPYVPEGDASSLPPDVLRYEPHQALFAGVTGLDVIVRLLRDASSQLAAGGRLVVEFGFGQDADVARLAASAGWHVVRVREDLQSIPRTIVLTRTN